MLWRVLDNEDGIGNLVPLFTQVTEGFFFNCWLTLST